MPQLVKGGKYTFGWTRVGNTGRITIPPEALEEYQLKESVKLLLIPGSRTSGGFGLGRRESIGESQLGNLLNVFDVLEESPVAEGEFTERKGKPYGWVALREGGVTIPPETLKKFGIETGDKLLVIRGSGLAVGFAVRGPIVEEAGKHPELIVFEPDT
jgi:bifunctional DNA-binding transcriptional regulator/antitoxin component of YhaV-PrlF toxin-antitoxin module